MSIYGMIGKKNTFPARELHKHKVNRQNAVNTLIGFGAQTKCSAKTIKRESKKLFRG